MPNKKPCPLCKNTHLTLLYKADQVPIFQNKVYADAAIAQSSPTAQISLTSCNDCGFVFNSAFNPDDVEYDTHYQNEQAHSKLFQEHLSSLIELFHRKDFFKKKIIEVGCGEGYFLEKMLQAGFNVTGFDPAYEGNNPQIKKDYFTNHYSNLAADVIILHHVLEHIPEPLDFLHLLAKAVHHNAQIFIEVPTLDWILHQEAFWDIFYEHCNYFTIETLSGMFTESEHGLLFNDQYMYVMADLKNLKKTTTAKPNKKMITQFSNFNDIIHQYRDIISQKPGTAIWGAGAKGVTFANLIDPQAHLISCLVDINPKKQHNYIAKSAHKILPPSLINTTNVNHILVMNDNYLPEIQKMLSSMGLNKIQLKKLSNLLIG